MKHVMITGVASPICWWLSNVNEVCPVLDVYKKTGYIKIRVKVIDKNVILNPIYFKEGWIPPEFVKYV
ncbi:hypothetical protein [Bacillus cereus]|uniref:Uncharacterized protein n=1 Tax=Bacillus cereus TaxID=1396 RepID=A0A164QDJ0_BACCE|nr:hypothetical protein [Bacillus cereus]KZD71159.1 hypothetical protein B4088_0889 [Bacillus cereus]